MAGIFALVGWQALTWLRADQPAASQARVIGVWVQLLSAFGISVVMVAHGWLVQPNEHAERVARPSVVVAIREREARQGVIADELAACDGSDDFVVALTEAVPEARRRLQEWRSVLTQETSQARQMLRALLEGRIVFTPRPELPAVDFAGRGDYGRIFVGLLDSQAMASPAGHALMYSKDSIRIELAGGAK